MGWVSRGEGREEKLTLIAICMGGMVASDVLSGGRAGGQGRWTEIPWW